MLHQHLLGCWRVTLPRHTHLTRQFRQLELRARNKIKRVNTDSKVYEHTQLTRCTTMICDSKRISPDGWTIKNLSDFDFKPSDRTHCFEKKRLQPHSISVSDCVPRVVITGVSDQRTEAYKPCVVRARAWGCGWNIWLRRRDGVEKKCVGRRYIGIRRTRAYISVVRVQ